MNNVRLLRGGIALFGLACGLTIYGQLSNINTTAPGNGTLRVNGRNVTLEKATVVLNSDKTAEIAVYGRENFRVKGRWAKGANDYTAEVTITNGNDDARGKGIVTFDQRYRLSKIDVSGTNRRGNFNVQFLTGYAPGTGGSGGNVGTKPTPGKEVSANAIGEGTLWSSGRTDKIKEVWLEFGKGGKLVITTVANGRKVEYSGEWFEIRGDKMDIRIDRGPNGGTEARGEIFLKNKDLYRIVFDGRDNRGPMEFRFQADSSTVGGTKPPSGGSDIEASARGRGTIVRGDGRGSLESATVEISRKGGATITLNGNKKYVFQGNWKEVKGGYEVTIVRGFDNLLTRGKATIRMEKSNLVNIEIEGRDGNGTRYSVSFRS